MPSFLQNAVQRMMTERALNCGIQCIHMRQGCDLANGLCGHRARWTASKDTTRIADVLTPWHGYGERPVGRS